MAAWYRRWGSCSPRWAPTPHHDPAAVMRLQQSRAQVAATDVERTLLVHAT